MKMQTGMFKKVRIICIMGIMILGLITLIGSGNSSRTDDGEGDQEELVSETNRNEITSDPMIAMDGDGNAILVANRQWADGTTTRHGIYYNVYSRGQGWTWPIEDGNMLTDMNGQPARNPVVAMDASGNGVAVWEQYVEEEQWCDAFGHCADVGPRSYRLYAAYFDGSISDWTNISHLDPFGDDTLPTGDVSNIDVAMDGSGNAVAVWQFGDDNPAIYGSRYNVSTGTWTKIQIYRDYWTDGINPKVGMDRNGDAIIVWCVWDSCEEQHFIYVNIFGEDGAYDRGAATSIGTGTSPQVSMDSCGRTIVVWENEGEIYACRCTSLSNGSWEEPFIVSNGTGDWASDPQIDISSNCANQHMGMSVWQETDDHTGAYSINAGLISVTANQFSVESVENSNQTATAPQVAITNKYYARAVWWQNESTASSARYCIYSNRFQYGRGWEGSHSVSCNEGLDIGHPQVAMDESDVAIAVWDDGLAGAVSGGSIHAYVWETWKSWGQPEAAFTISPSTADIDESVSFDASGSSDDGTITTYEWDFDYDGSSFDVDATGITVVHAYASAGTYTVSLRVTDNHNQTDETTREVTIGVGTPLNVQAESGDGVIDISWSPLSGAISYNIYWNTTGGVTISDNQVIGIADTSYHHADLTNSVTYYYIVTAVNDGNEGSPSVEVSATPQMAGKPHADFNWAPNPVAVDQLITFDASSSYDDDGGIIEYQWDFDYYGGPFDNDAIGMNVTHTFETAGTYNVRLRVIDTTLKWDEISYIIDVSSGSETYMLTVDAFAGMGTGLITADGISCGTYGPLEYEDCYETYEAGTEVYLVPYANTDTDGSTFSHWTGCDTDIGIEGCIVEMDGDKTVQAYFE